MNRLTLFILAANIAVVIFNTNSFAYESKSLNNFESKKYSDNKQSMISYEQMYQDYDYMWKILNENYPWWGVIERYKIDKEKIYNKYRNKIENIKSELEFSDLISDMAKEMKNTGHLNVLSSERYFEMLESYDNEYLKDWFNVLNNDISKETYTLMKDDSDILNSNKKEEIKSNDENISARIIEKDKIAYVKINDFVGDLEKDGEKLIQFYKKVSNYENLIIDITGNSGGRDEYWMDYIIAPNIDEAFIQNSFFLYKEGDYNKNFIDIEEKNSYFEFKPISEFPKTMNIEVSDLKYATHFLNDSNKRIEPKYDKKLFNGKIFLLVDDKVYSSSESFSIFSKSTGFATIVGTRTGGDGGGMTPILFSLPNSGLIVRFTILEFINPDGTNSEEYGTTPDIISKNEEDPLKTCINYINAEKNNKIK